MPLDAVVVGAGPNGLAAAITLARSGRRVVVLEAAAQVGGGARSEALTLPGFLHDSCSAVYPMAAASPFFQDLPLASHGLAWVDPPAPLAHPFDDGHAAMLERSLPATVSGLGRDGEAYRSLVAPFVARWTELADDLLGPPRFPSHPGLAVRFGWNGLRSAERLAASAFRGEDARALLAGLAAHAIMPLDRAGTSAIGLMLAIAGHVAGWPFAQGGSQSLSDALASHFRELGGAIELRRRVGSLDQLPKAKATLLDLPPRDVLRLAGHRFPPRYRGALQKFRHGPGVFKLDWALSGPVPWRAPGCERAGTLHLGGSLAEVVASEAAVGRGEHPRRPFVIAAQPSRFDPLRSPSGQHTLWAYCHVPNGSTVDMTEPVESQIERFAPGFRDLVLGRSARGPGQLEAGNPNLVGGDISGGENSLRQLLFRPTFQRIPYQTPLPGLYICSASTPPGGGVHGLCGYHAARAALRQSL